MVIYGFGGSFFDLVARSSCIIESKALLKSIVINEANCFTIRVNVIQVAVDPMLN